MLQTQFKELHFPDLHFEENIPWLEERLKKIEDETFKDATAILGKVAAGVAGCLAVSASILAARDTLFDAIFGSYFCVAGSFGLGTHFPLLFLVFFEVAGIASAFHQFRLAYEPIGMRIAPDYADGDGIARHLAEEPEVLKGSFLIETQKNINHNRNEILERNKHISVGFFDLFLVTSVVLFHAALGATLKFAS